MTEQKNDLLQEQESSNSTMFGPLSFEDFCLESPENTETDCLLCTDKFNLKYGKPIFLRHLLEVHHLVIAEVQNIKDLPRYVQFWREKFSQHGLEYFTPFLNVKDSGKYHLLSDDLQTDKNLRYQINLDYHLKKQEFERTDSNFKHKCLLCKLIFEGTRHGYINHVRDFHNLQLGNPQNLVHIEELVLKLEEKLDNLQCIYCEKFFPDRVILKEHMRKKLHKRIHPENSNYDKYYMINYLEDLPKSEKDIIEDDDDRNNLSGEVPDDEFVDWLEDEQYIYCLFCKVKETNLEVMFDHLLATHKFDFVREIENLDFYKRIKLINYIRKQIFHSKCSYCNLTCKNLHELRSHMNTEQHYKVPDVKVYNQPEYYFPTFENDTLLYLIDDNDDDKSVENE